MQEIFTLKINSTSPFISKTKTSKFLKLEQQPKKEPMLLREVVDSRPEARKHKMSLEYLMPESLKTCLKDRETSLKELQQPKLEQF